MSCKVSFIGLGTMGYPMAGYISKAGHNVTVFNRTKSKAEKWLKTYSGKMAETPAEAAKDSDFVFTCVGNDNDLKEVTFGENGIFKSIKKGSIYIDNTTASATIAKEIYDYAIKNNFGFLDAPVSGGQAGAENGALTVMIGGDQESFDKAKDIIDCYSKKMKLLGKAGNGQLAKMVNQICIAGLVQGLSEGINLTGVEAGVMFIQASMPSAVLTYLVGKMYSPKKITDSIASTVALSTFLSLFTLVFIVYFALKYFS